MLVSTPFSYLGVMVALLVAIVTAAPVAQKQLDSLKAALKNQLRDQEALEKLASLSDKDGTSGTEISKTKSMSYSNVNGAENSVQKAEEKVLDPITQKLVSDVKEKVEQKQESAADKPHTSVVASVDVPKEGIHKVLKDDDAPVANGLSMPAMGDMKGSVEFTPEVVAQYLYKTGEQQEFKDVLNDLVDASEISPEEAEQYEKTVMDELYKLDQSEQATDDDMTDMESLYPQGFADGAQPMFPVYNGMQEPEDAYPMYGYQKPEETEPYVNYLLNQPVTLDEMISSLLEEWLNKAIVSGDPEAEEILTNIVDYVSRDNNPDDETQVKQILSDIFAEALLEDLTPRLEPQQIDDVSVYPQSGRNDDVSVYPQQARNDDVKPIVQSSETPAIVSSEEKTDGKPEESSKTTDDLEEQLRM